MTVIRRAVASASGWWPGLLLAVLAFVVSWNAWTDARHVIAWGDVFFPLDQSQVLSKGMQSWSPDQFGALDYRLAGTPLRAFFALLQTLGLDFIGISRVFLSASWALSAFAMYLLALRFWKARSAAVVAAVWYIGGISFALALPNENNAVAMPLAPLLAYLAIRFLDAPLYLPLFAAASTLLGFVALNPPTALLATLVVAALWLVAVVSERVPWKKAVLAAALLAGGAIAVNLWWLVPAVAAIAHETLAATSYQDLTWTLRRADIRHLAEQTAFWGINYGTGPWAVMGAWYDDTFVFHAALVAMPIAAFTAVALAVAGRVRAAVSGMVAIAVTAMILAKGTHEPLALLNAFLYQHLPLYWLYREPTKFLAVLAMIVALLGGATVLALRNRFGPVRGAAIAAAFCLLALPTAYPLVSGAAFSFHHPDQRVQVPQYWSDAAAYLNRVGTPTARVLLLPEDDFYQTAYEWGLEGVDRIAETSLRAPVVRLTVSPNPYLVDRYGISAEHALSAAIRDQDPALTRALMARMSIGFVVVRADLAADPEGRNQSLAETRWLVEKMRLPRVATFGPLSVYTLPADVALTAPRAVLRSCLALADEASLAARLPADVAVIHAAGYCASEPDALRRIAGKSVTIHPGEVGAVIGAPATRSAAVESVSTLLPRRLVYPLFTDLAISANRIAIRQFVPPPAFAHVRLDLQTAIPLRGLRLQRKSPDSSTAADAVWSDVTLSPGMGADWIFTDAALSPAVASGVTSSGYVAPAVRTHAIPIGRPLSDVESVSLLRGPVEFIYRLPSGAIVGSIVPADGKGIDPSGAFERIAQRYERERGLAPLARSQVTLVAVVPWSTSGPQWARVMLRAGNGASRSGFVVVRPARPQSIRIAPWQTAYVGRIESNGAGDATGALGPWWNEGSIRADGRWVVMRQSYSDQWTASDATDHAVADGFAQAWRLGSSPEHTFAVRGAGLQAWLVAFGLIALVALAAIGWYLGAGGRWE